jgi:hypothetical protein
VSVPAARIDAVSLAKATADKDVAACLALIEGCDADEAQALIAESSALLVAMAQALCADINDVITAQDPALAAALVQLTVGPRGPRRQ